MNLRDWRKNLKHIFINIDKNKISTYQNIQKNKPTAVLFHGFGGNYFGLTPLGFELSKKYSIIICELPAHGKSSLETFEKIEDFQKFYTKLINKLNKHNTIDLIVAHSFSCYFVSDPEISKKIPTVIINPVFSPSPSFLAGMKACSNSKTIMVLSNLPVFSPLKVALIQKKWSLEAIKNVFQNMFFCQHSPKRLLSQKKNISIALNANNFSDKNFVKIAFIGKNDSTVEPFCEKRFKEIFPKAISKVVPKTGHLLPMENPKDIAEIILKTIK